MVAKRQMTAKRQNSANPVTMVEVYKRDAKRIARVKLEGDHRYTRDVVALLLDAAEAKNRKPSA